MNEKRLLIIASQNPHKTQEIGATLQDLLNLQAKEMGVKPLTLNCLGLHDLPGGDTLLIDEDGKDYRANALIKARACSNFLLSNKNCLSFRHEEIYAILADDSGLELSVLHGAPGLYSARYAKPHAQNQDQANRNKLLSELKPFPLLEDRKARFVASLCLYRQSSKKNSSENENYFFVEGQLNGKITLAERGKAGFGYDPIFIPDKDSPEKNKKTLTRKLNSEIDEEKTLAEMEASEKNKISHRAQALLKLAKKCLKQPKGFPTLVKN